MKLETDSLNKRQFLEKPEIKFRNFDVINPPVLQRDIFLYKEKNRLFHRILSM